jgi:hypothetical protein
VACKPCKNKSLAILLVLVMGVSLTFSFVPSAFAVAGSEFSNPTQTNAYASYNIETNDVQVKWNFNTLPTDTVCLLKGDFVWYEDLNDKHTSGVKGVDYDKVTGFIPLYYSVVSSSPVNVVNGGGTAEVVPCEDGLIRIDLDVIMSHSLNVNNYEDLEIFLSFYVAEPDGSLNLADTSRIDEVFVLYTSINIWDEDAQDYGCGGQIGSTLYIDKSGTNGATAIHGNNGDNCDGADFKYYELQSKEWVDMGMTNYPALAIDETNTGFHNTPFFSLLIEVVTSKSGGGCSGDCTPPTFGKDKYGRQIVEGGFSFDGNNTDVTEYWTPYKEITANTNTTHNFTFKAYENNGNNNIKWFQFGIVPEVGTPLNDAEVLATIYTKNSQIEKIVETDKNNLWDIIDATLYSEDCGYVSSDCLELSLDVIFREELQNKVIVIQVMDNSRNTDTKFLNDGINTVGESMNEPLISYVSASNGGAFYPQDRGLVELTMTSYKNNEWQDGEGYMWEYDFDYKTFRIIDTVPVPIKEPDVMWQAMTRINNLFPAMIIHEEEKAVLIFDSTKLISLTPDSWTYDAPKTAEEKQAELDIRISNEIDRITPLTKDYTKNQHLYQKDSYDHWNYFSDITVDQINQQDLEKKLQLQDELYQQRLAEQQKYQS